MKEKKSLGIIALLCLTIFIFLGTPSLAGEKLVVAVNANWPPMQMKDDAGNITGYEIDMIHAVAAEAGFQVKLVVVPWNSLFKELKAGTFDAVMASVSITKGRTARYDFSDPYFSTEQLIVVRKDQAEVSLTGKAIGIFNLSRQADALRKTYGCNMTYYTVEQIDQAFRDLDRGDLSGVLCDSPVALTYVYSHPTYRGTFTLAQGSVSLCSDIPAEKYGIAVRKGDTSTLDLINEGLQAVRAKGIESQLKEKWFKDTLPEPMLGYVH